MDLRTVTQVRQVALLDFVARHPAAVVHDLETSRKGGTTIDPVVGLWQWIPATQDTVAAKAGDGVARPYRS